MAETSRTADMIEWALGLAAAAGVVAIIVYLAWTGVPGRRQPAELSVEPAVVGSEGAVGFIARNRGGTTATDVSIVLKLTDEGGALVAEHMLTIDYLPANSETTGAFILPPRTEGLTRAFVVEGYLHP